MRKKQPTSAVYACHSHGHVGSFSSGIIASISPFLVDRPGDGRSSSCFREGVLVIVVFAIVTDDTMSRGEYGVDMLGKHKFVEI
jgi:hypothetical protein